jgi:small ubiquitin-related modifier
MDHKNREETLYKVGPRTRMGKVFAHYALKKGVGFGQLRFRFEGDRVSEDDTPSTLGLEDGDQLDVDLEQAGC